MPARLPCALSTLIVAMSLPVAGAVAFAAAPSSPGASADEVRRQVSRLIADLDSESYQQREAATQRLAELGEPALRALAKMQAGRIEIKPGSSSPEVAWRATKVLGAMCSGEDESLAERAAGVLETFAEGKDSSLAAHARRELRDWRIGRQERAVKTIREMGGVVLIDPTVGDRDSSYLVRIDENWRGGNEGLRALRNIVWLGTVEIRNPEINDEAIEPLMQARDLKRLHLWDHRLTMRGVDRLKAARGGDLEVSWFGKAVLGITGNLEHRNGCLINSVVPGSGADQAGLLPGDVITKIDGKPVEGFADLTLHMAEHKVDERVPVEVRRDGATRKVAVVLGAREDSALRVHPLPFRVPAP